MEGMFIPIHVGSLHPVRIGGRVALPACDTGNEYSRELYTNGGRGRRTAATLEDTADGKCSGLLVLPPFVKSHARRMPIRKCPKGTIFRTVSDSRLDHFGERERERERERPDNDLGRGSSKSGRESSTRVSIASANLQSESGGGEAFIFLPLISEGYPVNGNALFPI